MSYVDRPVSVSARPLPVEVTPESTAVIVVDMQNDFATAGGMFDRANIDIGCIRSMVPRVAEVLRVARLVGIPVVYVKMAFQSDLSDTGGPNSPTWLKHLPLQAGASVVAPDGSASRVLIRDTWNTDVVTELTPAPDDVVLYKHRYSGFYETGIDRRPARSGRDEIDRDGCAHERVRRIDRSRCDVPGLSLPCARGLHGRADRVRHPEVQPRGLIARPGVAVRVDHRFDRTSRSSPTARRRFSRSLSGPPAVIPSRRIVTDMATAGPEPLE